MKKKLIVKETGKSIEIGDTLERHYHHVRKDGTEVTGTLKVTITEQNVEKLIKRGLLTVQTFAGNTSYKGISNSPASYLINFVNNITDNKTKIATIIASLAEIGEYQPSVLFSIILRQIAITLDQRYEGDIKDSKEIYGISVTDGKVFRIPKEHIKNYKNFAAFRTEEDAKFALNVLKYWLKCMYK